MRYLQHILLNQSEELSFPSTEKQSWKAWATRNAIIGHETLDTWSLHCTWSFASPNMKWRSAFKKKIKIASYIEAHHIISHIIDHIISQQIISSYHSVISYPVQYSKIILQSSPVKTKKTGIEYISHVVSDSHSSFHFLLQGQRDQADNVFTNIIISYIDICHWTPKVLQPTFLAVSTSCTGHNFHIVFDVKAMPISMVLLSSPRKMDLICCQSWSFGIGAAEWRWWCLKISWVDQQVTLNTYIASCCGMLPGTTLAAQEPRGWQTQKDGEQNNAVKKVPVRIM